jgi:putative phosphoesterase
VADTPTAAGCSTPDRQMGMGASETKSARHIVGVISDTHGLVRPDALDRLRGSDLIVHCGDIGAAAVLDALRTVAPVRAVRGNNDKGPWATELPTDDVIEVGGYTLYVIHDLGELSLEPAAAGFTAVLSGHSHRPMVESRKGVLFVNPGSAGPRRFSLPVTIAQLVLAPRRRDARIIELAA